MEMPWIFLVLDPYLIWWYRLTGLAAMDFFLGTAALVCFSLLLGEISFFLASRAVRKYADSITAEATRYSKLSLTALAAGDRAAYQAANRLANEAFGKSFFIQVTQSAAFFWSPVFALAWMQYRFFELEFPLPFIGFSLGYIGIFILVYLLGYLGWKRVKRGLSRRGRLQNALRFNPSTQAEPGKEKPVSTDP